MLFSYPVTSDDETPPESSYTVSNHVCLFTFYACLFTFVLFLFFPQGLFSSLVPSATVNDRTEFPLVIVLGVTAVVTLSLLCITLIAACVWRHRKRLGILGQKGGLVRIEAACCCLGQGADEAGQGGSASTSEGKPNH